MKLVREHISFTQDSDPIHDMNIGTKEISFMKDERIVFYNSDTNEFEYRNNLKTFYNTRKVYSYLKTKKYLVYVHNNLAIGWIESSVMASYMSRYTSSGGSLYSNVNLYREFKKPYPVDIIKEIAYNPKKGKMNENLSFTQDSDPIHDMEIGSVALGKFSHELKQKHRQLYKNAFKDLLLGRTITGHFNYTSYAKNKEAVPKTGPGWGKYTFHVSELELDDFNEQYISIIAYDTTDLNKIKAYIIPLSTDKIIIKD